MKRALASLASKCQCAAPPWLCRMEPSRGGCSAGAQLPERRRHRAPLRSGTGTHRGIPGGVAPPPEAPGSFPTPPPARPCCRQQGGGGRSPQPPPCRLGAGWAPGAPAGVRRPVRCGGCAGGVRGCAGPLCKASWRGLARAAAAGRLRTARSGAGFCVRSGLLRRGVLVAGARGQPAPASEPSPCGSHVLGARGHLHVWGLTPGSRQRGGSAPNPR